MSTENNPTTLNGFFKVCYADSIADLIPDAALLQKLVPFADEEKQPGLYYSQPLALASETGYTYNGSAGNGNSSLTAPSAGTMKEAQVYGTEIFLRSQLSSGALNRSMGGGKKAFKKASGWKVLDMAKGMRKRLEISMWYGQSGVATVSSLSSQVITVTDATWASGIWAGSENFTIDVFQSDGVTRRQMGLVISAVDPDLKKLTVTGTTTGIVATDVIFIGGTNASNGTAVYNEMAGIKKILTNTGTLFNINAGSYSLFKGNSVTSVGQIGHGKIQDFISRAVGRGLMGKVTAFLSPKGWGVLNSDQSALRQYPGNGNSYNKKAENGFETLTFFSSNGEIEMRSHPMLQDGDCFVLPLEEVSRVGSVDLSFNIPGSTDTYFLPVSGTNNVELMASTDQAVFIEKPAHCVYGSGLTYS